MEYKGICTGSSETPGRGRYCPSLPPPQVVGACSGNGQNTSRVSTVGTRIGLATAEERLPPPEYFPGLKDPPEDSVARALEGPRPLESGEFLREREQVFRGIVQDTIRRCDRIVEHW